MAADIDANRAPIRFKEMPITDVEANHDTLRVAICEILSPAVERATLVHDFEARQNPAFLDMVAFDGFMWESVRSRGH